MIAESVIGEDAGPRQQRRHQRREERRQKSRKKKPKLIKTLSQNVNPGPNTLKLKLTGAAKETLRKKGSVKLKVKFDFTSTGGTVKSVTQTFNVKAPAKKPVKKHGAGRWSGWAASPIDSSAWPLQKGLRHRGG